MKPKFTFITICGGIGMGSAALKAAGGKEIACIDWGELQEQAYTIIDPQVCYLRCDIRKFTMKMLNDYLLKKGRKPIKEVDVIVFSTPCTYASALNYYRTPFAELNLLTCEQIPRIVQDCKPTLGFICENTASIKTDWEIRPMYTELRQKLKKINLYKFSDAILDSADFKCWTSRPRWIMFGMAKSLDDAITFPQPTTKDESQFYLNKLIPDAIAYSPGLYRQNIYDGVTGQLIGKEDKWYAADRILGTVTASGGEKIRLKNGTERKLTIAELKTIFGIEHFNFGNISEADIHFLIGNGIVVPFMKVVAEHFIKQTLIQ